MRQDDVDEGPTPHWDKLRHPILKWIVFFFLFLFAVVITVYVAAFVLDKPLPETSVLTGIMSSGVEFLRILFGS